MCKLQRTSSTTDRWHQTGRNSWQIRQPQIHPEGATGWRNGPAETYPDIEPGECKVLSLGRTAPALVCALHPRAEQAQSILISVDKHLKSGCKEDRAWLFPVVPSGRTRHHGHKLECWRVPLHIRNTFLPARVTKSRPKLLREIVRSPSLEIFQDVVRGSWCLVALPEQGGTRYTPELPRAYKPVIWWNLHPRWFFCTGIGNTLVGLDYINFAMGKIDGSWRTVMVQAGRQVSSGGFAVIFIAPTAPTHQTPSCSNSTWLGWAQEGPFACLREQHNGSLSSDVCYSYKM